MIIIGILFLVVDTFSDRKIKGRQTASQDHHHAENHAHAHAHHEKNHEPVPAKKHKKVKTKVVQKD